MGVRTGGSTGGGPKPKSPEVIEWDESCSKAAPAHATPWWSLQRSPQSQLRLVGVAAWVQLPPKLGPASTLDRRLGLCRAPPDASTCLSCRCSAGPRWPSPNGMCRKTGVPVFSEAGGRLGRGKGNSFERPGDRVGLAPSNLFLAL